MKLIKSKLLNQYKKLELFYLFDNELFIIPNDYFDTFILDNKDNVGMYEVNKYFYLYNVIENDLVPEIILNLYKTYNLIAYYIKIFNNEIYNALIIREIENIKMLEKFVISKLGRSEDIIIKPIKFLNINRLMIKY